MAPANYMALPAGTRLGPYEILSPIGAGGMGEVYRGRDTRLDRTVAIKVLAAHFSSQPDLRQRFEREARAVSSLNHPHICILHDVGHQDGVDFLVMEYLEGETLAVRLSRGPLPIEQAVPYAIQIADALALAHRQGVFHRDLKPGNIMLTKSGAKLLDFGLAKIAAPAGAGSLTTSPTQGAPLTTAGTILGTFQYMAPEQLEGHDADARSDVFSFGAVLYEMVTGRKAFEGRTQASVAGAILHTEPPSASSLQPGLPPALDRLIRRCLLKDPEQRWQTARDLASELQWIVEAGAPAPAPAAIPVPTRLREKLFWPVTAIAVVALLAFALSQFRRPPEPAEAIRFVISPPEKASFTGFPSVSPDGRRVAAVVADASGKRAVWVRSLDALAAQPLPGSEESLFSFWSPDSRSLGFFSQGRLKTVAVSGGAPQVVCAVPESVGATWNQDGVILFGRFADVVHSVPATGGVPVPVTSLDKSRQEVGHRLPYFLPDGRRFLYYAFSRQAENNAVYAGSLDSKEKKLVVRAGSAAVYAAPGYLLYLRENTLVAHRFDAGKLQVVGEPAVLAEQVGQLRAISLGYFSASSTGVLTHFGEGTANSQLAWLDRTGKRLGSVGPPGAFSDPWLSPDEKRVALGRIDRQSGNPDIWIMEFGRGTLSRFTFDPAMEHLPVWSPDGSRVAYDSHREGAGDIYQKMASGAGGEELLLKWPEGAGLSDWSRDGKFLAYQSLNSKTHYDIWILPLSGDRKPVPFLQSEFNERSGQFSPDGRWMAYVSDESGRVEVYVQSFPPGGGKWQISTNGGAEPQWRRDGKELFYLAPDNKLMAVDIQSGKGFEAGVPKSLLEVRVGGVAALRNHYTVSADGRRFLINAAPEDAPSSPITVVLNWTAALKR